ncbi:MAG: hypothetical protein K6A92_05170, partial [Lachnospiraceae bacterium]|nr:hypothetical protein [Lachnospiraceae bacterium]
MGIVNRRILSFFILLFYSIVLFSPMKVSAEENLPTRVINVVYDDSGSMIRTHQNNVDTWCQAKYSMEVFAAMLGERDTMNVYVMSDYDHGQTSAPPRLSLSGSDGSEANVAKVHNMITAAGNTPFNAVRKAYNDLANASADEKWLVILTDGAFEDGAFTNQQVDEYLSVKDEDINVMFMGMGADAADITASDEKHIYSEKAQNNAQILEKITQICTRIFNSNKLQVDVSSGDFSFDIPMSEIVVFAQGDGVSIDGITDGNGSHISPDKKPVNVRYSETPSSKGYTEFIVDDKLNGYIATFRGDFAPGHYTANVNAAQTVEVYYKPNVEIMLYLVDSEGQEVPYTDGVRSGDYEVKFGFVKAGTNEKVTQSTLLGDVKYDGAISFNHEEEKPCANG